MSTGGRARLIKTIVDRISRTNELATQMSQTAAGWTGINTTDMQCLQLLQHGPLTAGDLARFTGLTTASITTVIDRPEGAGFVARHRNSSDRRRVVVELQPDRARSAIVPLFMPVIRRWRKVLADYDTQDLELIADFLNRIDDGLESEITRPDVDELAFLADRGGCQPVGHDDSIVARGTDSSPSSASFSRTIFARGTRAEAVEHSQRFQLRQRQAAS